MILNDGTNNYIYGPNGVPFEQINTKEEPTYLHHDQQGSTRLLTGSTGTVTGAYTYTPYGAVESHTGTATTSLDYNAQYTSTETGLIYLRARAYDPSRAQFMSVDPAVEVTQQPYVYALDNPLNRNDPSGLLSLEEVGEAIGIGAVCVATDGSACVAAGLGLLDKHVIENDVNAVQKPCSASSELVKTLSESVAFGLGAGVAQIGSLSEDIEKILENAGPGGKFAQQQLKALGVTSGTITSLLYAREHSNSTTCSCG